MKALIKKVPVPTAGVALGLAALGNLLQPCTEILHLLCGAIACVLIVMLAAKIILFPSMIKDDMKNSIMASVSATLFMTRMQLATYAAPFAYPLAWGLWACAIIAHLGLMVWFTLRFITQFKLHEVFPTYFICYVGIIVASATSPVFGMEMIGRVLLWFGFACYLVLLALVTYRYVKHEIPETARPLFCIYTAPMSLSIVGYLACTTDPSLPAVMTMLVLAQALFVLVLFRLPHFMRLPFYPSFAAMTFPFVITATALGKSLDFFRMQGMTLSPVLDVLFVAETVMAVIMVAFVLAHYMNFFIKRVEQPASAAVVAEDSQIARFSENFSD